MASAEKHSVVQQRLGIPPAIAAVTDMSLANPHELPRYILIQDLHEHLEAQGAITAILLYGRRAWGTREVFVEGAQGPLERSSLRAEHSGAERAVLMDTEQSLSLVGIEDWDVYRENLSAYFQTRRLQKAALHELDTIRVLGRTLDVKATSRPWDRLERMIRLELRPQEYADAMETPTLLRSPSLAQALESASQFYRLATHRSSIFLAKSAEVNALGPRILVVGGFHTPDMADALRQKGESFVVLTPRITRMGDDKRYAKRMEESLSALRLNEASR